VENAHLLCPRPVQFQFGDNDKLIAGMAGRAKTAIERLGQIYKKLGVPDRFEHRIFPGGHEFQGDLAWEFLNKHL
jgi:hypothetical protein